MAPFRSPNGQRWKKLILAGLFHASGPGVRGNCPARRSTTAAARRRWPITWRPMARPRSPSPTFPTWSMPAARTLRARTRVATSTSSTVSQAGRRVSHRPDRRLGGRGTSGRLAGVVRQEVGGGIEPAVVAAQGGGHSVGLHRLFHVAGTGALAERGLSVPAGLDSLVLCAQRPGPSAVPRRQRRPGPALRTQVPRGPLVRRRLVPPPRVVCGAGRAERVPQAAALCLLGPGRRASRARSAACAASIACHASS